MHFIFRFRKFIGLGKGSISYTNIKLRTDGEAFDAPKSTNGFPNPKWKVIRAFYGGSLEVKRLLSEDTWVRNAYGGELAPDLPLERPHQRQSKKINKMPGPPGPDEPEDDMTDSSQLSDSELGLPQLHLGKF